MKFGTKLQYECPDGETCSTCILKPEYFYQGCMCTRCPVFNCKEPVTEEDKYFMPILPANEFRDDWAKEWDNFFKTSEQPKLYL
jgi:hypothetical protein